MKIYGEESSLSLTFTYDVFLSFRGADTRHTFIGYLHKELCRKGINTFVDDENLRIGEGISPALSKAIEQSRISIIVFSENYASSTWCLNELVKILDCVKRNNKQLVFPVFYHVDPSDVRHQKNSYGEAMIKLENKFGIDKVKAWRLALFEVANFSGLHFNTGYEINFIEKVVEEVYKTVAPKPLHCLQDPIGLEHHMEEGKSLLDMKPHDDTVCMLGIYGLGGIGKTELAKALYDKIVHQFEAASFLESVREKSNRINGLEDLQKTLLSEMLEELQTELGSTSRGIYEIKSRLRQKKVLLVLDDVDDIKKLEILAGGRDWFGSGSRIIITTRDKDLLIAHQVEGIYKMTELNDEHALELFCRNAFKQNHPKTGYEDASLRAVSYAKGLPLALKVIGSDLATYLNLDAWECALEEYDRIPNKGIQDVLKISYDRLGNNAKQVFLDIACFFKGKRIDYVKMILEEFGATCSINLLVNKSLLTIEHDCLQMHDLIQAMGREIVRQEAPNPGKRSRLWFYEDVIEVLTEDSGSDSIEGIMLDPPQREEVDWSGNAYEKLKWLRILIIRNTSFSSGPKLLPNHLRLLDWDEYPSKSFPPKFHPKKIIVFSLYKSNLTPEEPFKKYSWLTSMNFSYNQSITKMPDVSEVQNLRELRLHHCMNLIEVHESVGFLPNLAHLSASECIKLRNFLQRMFLPSLEVLDLNLCLRLEQFPEVVKKMNKPLKIYIMNTAIRELPDSIGNLIGLVHIEMLGCRKIRYLSNNLLMLPNVVAFNIGWCSQFGEFFRRFVESPSATKNVHSTLRTLYFRHGGLSDENLHALLLCFPKLEELIAWDNDFISLPASINECVHMTRLDVSFCEKLKKIPECKNLRILTVHHCVKLEEISKLPSTIQKVDARYCFSLTKETSTMLWSLVSKETHGLEVAMPKTEIPEWFDFKGNGENPRFQVHGKCPIFALVLVMEYANEMPKLYDLVVNGQRVPCRSYYNFRIVADHVLICDLRVLLSEKKWHKLDALFTDHDWNEVQVSCDGTLSCWGVYLYKHVEDDQFMCPPTTAFTTRSNRKLKPINILRMMLTKAEETICELLTEMIMGFQARGIKEILESLESWGKWHALDDEHSIMAFLLDQNNEIVNGESKTDQPPKFYLEDKDEVGEQEYGNDPQQQEKMVGGYMEDQISSTTLVLDSLKHWRTNLLSTLIQKLIVFKENEKCVINDTFLLSLPSFELFILEVAIETRRFKRI